jgi:hypothetical protein
MSRLPTKGSILSWRSGVMVGLFVAGVVVFLLLFGQPARQGFSADLQVVSNLEMTPGSLYLEGLSPAVKEVYEKAGRFVLTGADSLWADNPHGYLPHVRIDPNAHSSILARTTQDLTLLGSSETEPVSMTIYPDRDRTCRTVSVDFGAGVSRVSASNSFAVSPSEPTREYSLFVSRVQSTSALKDNYLEGILARQDVWIEDTTRCRSVLQIESDAYVDTASAGVPTYVPLPDSAKRITALGGWVIKSDSAGVEGSVEVRGRFGPADSITLMGRFASETAYVDAEVCTLQVYSATRRGPISVRAPIQLKATGVFNVSGSATASGLRVRLSGVASSLTYQYVSRGSTIGQAVQILPSKLEEFSSQTVAFAAMLFAFLTLLRFVWDVFLKGD